MVFLLIFSKNLIVKVLVFATDVFRVLKYTNVIITFIPSSPGGPYNKKQKPKPHYTTRSFGGYGQFCTNSVSVLY